MIHRRTRLRWIILVSIAMCLRSYGAGTVDERPSIVFLHSYGPTQTPARFREGCISRLPQNEGLKLRYEYLDAKTCTSKEYLDAMQAMLCAKYANVPLSLVIAAGDDALDFALKHQEDVWKHVPIVFYGASAFAREGKFRNLNVTGVVRAYEQISLLRSIGRMRPQLKTIHVISDQGPSADKGYAHLLSDCAMALPNVGLRTIECANAEELGAKLAGLPDDSVAFLLSYWKNKAGQVVLKEDLARALKRSRVPIFGNSHWMLGDGIAGVVTVDSFEHGAVAGELAARIIAGIPALSLPVVTQSASKCTFDAIAMQRYGIGKSDIPKGSVIINEPFSFYRQYKNLVWITLSVILLLGGFVFMLALNIVQRRRATDRLKASESKLQAIFAQTFQLTGLLDTKGTVVLANATALRFIDAKLSDVAGRLFWECPWWTHDPAQQKRVSDAVSLAAKGECVRFQAHHRTPDGELRAIDFSIKPIFDEAGKVIYLLPEGRDMSDMRRAEEHLRAVLDNAPIVLWAVDTQGVFTHSLGSGLRALKFHPGQVVGQSVYDVYRNHPSFMDHTRRALAGEEGSHVIRLSGTWFETHHAPRIGPNGAVIGAIGVALDITQRMKAQETEQRLATAVEQSAEEIIVTDIDGAIQYVNPAFEKVTGYSREEVLGKTPRILKSGHQDAVFYQELWDTILSGKTWTGRFHNKRKDGELYVEDATITPLLEKDGRVQGFVGVKRDVTAQVQLEESLRQAQRTEAIGKLAGGIAHDFNNILQVIHANTTFAKEPQSSPSEMAEYLDQIQQAAVRATALTRQLLAFSRRQTLQFAMLDPAHVVADVIKLIRRIIGEHIQIEFSAESNLDHVRADVGQIEQMMLNLCVNARDAMPHGGRLSLKLRNVTHAADETTGALSRKPGRYVEIAVADTGIGMDESTIKRIFEPFFTTKPVGQGTGLGLSVVQGIVHQHEGFIQVDSKAGQGTVFLVCLPSISVSEEESALLKGREEMRAFQRQSGHETVLLAEDDAGVRHATHSLLARYGYRVLLAADGEEACQVAAANLHSIEIAVFDVIMPRLGGLQAARRLLSMKADIPVILCSGYAEGITDTDELPDPSWKLIKKPYAANELLKEIRDALDNREKA
ncbi:MAG: ABC transporter substrate binding protein [Opitutaceae bacterium]|jgi:PAS domain S-box-containing protein